MDLRARINKNKKQNKADPAASNREALSPAEEGHDDELKIGGMEEVSAQERYWKPIVYKKLLKVMDLTVLAQSEEDEARKQIHQIVNKLMSDESVPLNTEARIRVIKRIEDEILGLGPLEPLLDDPSVADILVNRHDQVYVERFGKLQLTKVAFDNNEHVMNILERIVTSVGRRVDESSPMVDARLADGSRVNAIIPPLAVDAPLISIRRFSRDMLGMEDLIRLGAISQGAAKMLEAVVKGRLNVIISGGTGSGKTTLLNILSGFIPGDERIVTIEDSAELQLRQDHVVRLETRPPNIEGKGEVTARDLVKNSLRMRPERIVIGEVRGGEALDMLQAMNTGHDGSLTTVHANTPRDALGRIENMVAMTGLNLPQKALRAQITSAVDLIVQTQRLEDGKRRIISVQEVNGMEEEVITMSEIFHFQRQGVDENGKVLGQFRATGVIPKFYEQLSLRGLEIGREFFDPSVVETGEVT